MRELIDSAPSKNSAQENMLNVTSSSRDRDMLRNNSSGCIRKQQCHSRLAGSGWVAVTRITVLTLDDIFACLKPSPSALFRREVSKVSSLILVEMCAVTVFTEKPDITESCLLSSGLVTN